MFNKKVYKMNQLLRYSGIIAILAGVVVLGLYHSNVMTGNGTLVTAGTLMLLGLLGYIFLNKIYHED